MIQNRYIALTKKIRKRTTILDSEFHFSDHILSLSHQIFIIFLTISIPEFIILNLLLRKNQNKKEKEKELIINYLGKNDSDWLLAVIKN